MFIRTGQEAFTLEYLFRKNHPETQGFQAGQRCRVAAGPLRGIEGTMVRKDGRTRVVLHISTLGVGASLCVEADLLEPI